MRRHFLPILGIVLLSLPILYTLAQGVTNATTDGWAHLFRQVVFDKTLRDGQFPPSWAGEAVFGFGSPVFLFNWTLPYYFVELLLFLGIPLIPATHIFFGFSLLGGAIVMYFLLRKLGDLRVLGELGSLGAFVGAILYLYAPYRLLNVFIYGAWGEILALFFGPLLLLWVIKLFERQTRLMFLSGGILTALLILTHNVLSIMFIAMAGTLAFFMYIGGVLKKKDKISLGRFGILGLLGLVFGVLLTSFFWVPAVIDKNLIYASNLAGWSVRVTNYKTLSSMLTIGWDNLTQKQTFYTSFTVGLPIFLIFLAAIVRLPKSAMPLKLLKEYTQKEIIFIWAFFWFVLSMFLSLPMSEPVWDKLPALQLFLYPYRFIAGMTVCGAILAGYIFSGLGRLGRLGVLGVLIIAIMTGLPYLKPAIDHGKLASSYFYSEQPPYWAPGNWISLGNEDFLPKTVPREFLWSLQKKGKPRGLVELGDLGSLGDLGRVGRDSKSATFSVRVKEFTVLTANIFYFPGWRVFDKGKEISSVSYDQNGRITFPVSTGQHTILMKFTDTPIHTYSKIFSLVAFLGFLGLGVLGRKLKIFTS